MNPLPCVPTAAMQYVTALLDGDPETAEGTEGPRWRSKGWRYNAESTRERIAELDHKIERYQATAGYSGFLEGETLPDLRQEKARATEYLERLEGDIACITRLVTYEAMKDAYAALISDPQFTDETKWRHYLWAALVAREDFSQVRDQKRLAKEQAGKIAATAQKLAEQLDAFTRIGLMGPGEFFSIPALLRETENPDERNRHMWRSLRGHILGDLPPREQPQPDPEWSGEIVLVDMDASAPRDIERENADDLRYAWGTAPRVQDLLTTLASVAQGFTPEARSEMEEAALSRQKAPVAEYLRAFWHLLGGEGFTGTTTLINAMAATATVAINDPSIVVSSDSVRRVIERSISGG